jgi:ribosomal protein L34E
MSHLRSAIGAPPQEGAAGGPAEPDPRRPLDRCARCGDLFRCGVNEQRPCWCTGMQLDAATLAALAHRYHGCLCARCLAQAAVDEPTRG